MSVVIRLKRTGRKNRPCYRISVADSRSPRDGRVIEHLGLHDPIFPRPEEATTLNVERARHWISVGAQPSETVRSIFKAQGVWDGGSQPAKAKRDRSARKQVTTPGQARLAAKSAREEAKGTRRLARQEAKRAAAAAAAAESASEE
ncbi:MAG: 30S ribosomal protein S16 [Planctomycetota bacterium]|jgi:small subunit ribosomal protein S16|nr:30S ribosomal protein S16 [Planctomycetota bacterium]